MFDWESGKKFNVIQNTVYLLNSGHVPCWKCKSKIHSLSRSQTFRI